MKFKVGEIVKLIGYSVPHGIEPSNGFPIKIGETFTILDYYVQESSKQTRYYSKELGTNWYIPEICIGHTREPNEFDYLDNIQRNIQDDL